MEYSLEVENDLAFDVDVQSFSQPVKFISNHINKLNMQCYSTIYKKFNNKHIPTLNQ